MDGYNCRHCFASQVHPSHICNLDRLRERRHPLGHAVLTSVPGLAIASLQAARLVVTRAMAPRTTGPASMGARHDPGRLVNTMVVYGTAVHLAAVDAFAQFAAVWGTQELEPYTTLVCSRIGGMSREVRDAIVVLIDLHDSDVVGAHLARAQSVQGLLVAHNIITPHDETQRLQAVKRRRRR